MLFNKEFVVVFSMVFVVVVVVLTDPVEPLPTEEALALLAQPHHLLAVGGKFQWGTFG